MKTKTLTLLVLFCVAITSCSKDESNNKSVDVNALDGTKWISTYLDDSYFVFEFGLNTVTGYVADENFIIDSKTSSTNYYINGSDVVFNELIIDSGWWNYRFTNAVQRGSVITIDRQMETSSNSWGSPSIVQFSKY